MEKEERGSAIGYNLFQSPLLMHGFYRSMRANRIEDVRGSFTEAHFGTAVVPASATTAAAWRFGVLGPRQLDNCDNALGP